MTIANWVQAQKANPTINQVVTWMESEKLDTVKVGDEMSQELKHPKCVAGCIFQYFCLE